LIFGTDASGLLVSFSKGGEKVLGYSWEEVAGRPIQDFAEDPESFERMLAASEKEGHAVALDFHFRHKEGRTIHCHVSLMDLINREGQRVFTLGVCQDITLWKKLQEDLIRVDRLAEIGRIAAGVAHEVNNPLAVIDSASRWAGQVLGDAKGLSPDDRKELENVVQKIGAQVRRCRDITHKLLGFVRDSAPTRTEFDIHELIEETIGLLKPELKYTTIEIDLKLAEGSLSVNSDSGLLRQVLVNFIANAIHAILEKGGDDGRIEIRTFKDNSEVGISVKDNGAGIPGEDREKIFDLFYTTKPTGKGTGLGLPICQNIVRSLGGKIAVESEVGTGSTFTVQIPG
jgi:two-component system NtrC family sensor kinase